MLENWNSSFLTLPFRIRETRACQPNWNKENSYPLELSRSMLNDPENQKYF